MLRFLQPVPTFHDDASDPAENLVRNTAFAGHHLTGEIGKGLGVSCKGLVNLPGKAVSSGTAGQDSKGS